jgi:voltage-gated potassium channel
VHLAIRRRGYCRRVARPRLVERRTTRFLREPLSVRNAVNVIVTAAVLVSVTAGVLMWLLDNGQFPNVWLALWWSVQTVTTVGYGDVVPKDVPGRIVATVVMLQGIAFLTIVTAGITSTFVTRAQRELAAKHDQEPLPETKEILARLDDVVARLDRLERGLGEQPRR